MLQEYSDNVDKKDFALEVQTIYRNTTGATWLFSITIILEKVEKATPCAISPSLPWVPQKLKIDN